MNPEPVHPSSSNHPAVEAYQLVCLEHEQQRLYAEVIQVVAERDIAWLRPWAIVSRLPAVGVLGDWAMGGTGDVTCIDVRQGPDLLLPLKLLRPALDTEILPLFTQIDPVAPPPDKDTFARSNQHLRQIIGAVSSSLNLEARC